MPISAGSAWLRRLGLNHLPVADAPPLQRYEWPQPGDLLHVDITSLGRFRQVGHRIHGNPQQASRGTGWEYVFLTRAVDCLLSGA